MIGNRDHAVYSTLQGGPLDRLICKRYAWSFQNLGDSKEHLTNKALSGPFSSNERAACARYVWVCEDAGLLWRVMPLGLEAQVCNAPERVA